MAYWWVNQNQTFNYEVDGGFLWSPQKNKLGVKNKYWETMKLVQPGDLVFSFADSKIKAIGIAKHRAVDAPRPELGPASRNWENLGWRVNVEFKKLDNPFRPKDYLDLLSEFLGAGAPLQLNGNGRQLYLIEIAEKFAQILLALAETNQGKLESELANYDSSEYEADIENSLEFKQIKGDSFREQVVLSRVGQGQFRANLRLVEKECRVTHLQDVKHLRASHIKPWSKSSDQEKVDGYNGLLLSPHVDHLFDRGFLTFDDSGEIIYSKFLNIEVVQKWSLDSYQNVGSFTKEQSQYLEYHRDMVFEQKR